ncbi:MAG TPA: flavin reductase family protein [Gemmatimonadaceae bacterium]|nr:flavin reductase family protein [Gemmatimonadaceae bacterium]HRQ78680.1 flavin reductase family protein [Gemmatimonadaceae bacterium]
MELTLSTIPPRDRHALLTPLIAPRPIALVSTLSAAGVGNLAPFSFFAMGGQNPQGIAICPTADRHGNPKDTLRNIRESGEFTVNIVSREMAERVNQASAPYASDVDEFDVSGFTRMPSRMVKPPRVAEAPAALECRVFQVIPQGEGPMHGTWVLGEVLHLWVRDDVLAEDGRPDTAKVHPAARMGRDEWAHVTPETIFRLTRPTVVPKE